MKNVNKPVNALASTRARLGLTQDQMAEQLGISHSMVKMIETNKRFLSSVALIRLASLEIRLAALPEAGKSALPACVKELYDNAGKDYAQLTKSHELNCTYKAMILENKLEKMQADHEELVSCLHSMEAISKTQYDESSDPLTYNLLLNRTRLLQKLSRCSPQEQAIARNRIAMLYAEVSLNKSIYPRYVHTNEKPTIF
ncbi:MAG: helix-turn-helix domain-containing protein [Ferruginibacter sp.]